MALPTHLTLEVVTPEGLLLREDVDELVAPGASGYFGVRPGHTPFMTTLGMGTLSYKKEGQWGYLSCFWGFCEVLPDKVNVMAELGERAEEIDVGRAALAKKHAEDRMKQITDEAGFREARAEYIRAVTRLAVAEHHHHPRHDHP
jgi:F-type H+-transporting ATPase subunit epsilon